MRLLDLRWWFGLKPKIVFASPKKYSISVIIPAYNEEKSIAATVESIKKQTVEIGKIIVVDDCSSDRTGEIAAASGAIVVRTSSNQGTKAMAQNYVLPLIDADLAVTVDADTLLHEDAVRRTLPYFNDPKTASVCGFVIPQKIETIWERGRFIEYLFGLSVFKAAQNNVGAILVSSGCFSVFRMEHLKKFKFNPRTMAEDMDLTWDFLNAGFAVYYAPDAYCYPLDPSTGRIYVNQIDRWCRSFFQNVKVHSFRRNKKVGAFVYGYLLEGVIAPLVTIGALFYLTGDFWFGLSLSFLIELLLVSVPCAAQGVKLGMLRKVLISIPAYFVVRYVNLYVFLRSFWKEMIIGEKLTVWEKGH